MFQITFQTLKLNLLLITKSLSRFLMSRIHLTHLKIYLVVVSNLQI